MLRTATTLLALLHPAPLPVSVIEAPAFLPTTPLIATIKEVVPAPAQPLALLPFPVAPYGTYSNTYAPANCTSYVASRKQIPNSWGNANTWGERAAAQGLTVSDVPITGSIAQSSRGGYGHVAVVVATAAGQVLLAEQNYDYQGSIREAWAPSWEYRYIYV